LLGADRAPAQGVTSKAVGSGDWLNQAAAQRRGAGVVGWMSVTWWTVDVDAKRGKAGLSGRSFA